MSEVVRSFQDLAEGDRAAAGGKGGTLARLFRSGYPVPEGFVVLPEAFAGDELRPEGWAQVQAGLARMRKRDPGASFAVRSSALSEDSASASFAGEFETVLDVHTDETIREAVRTVRRSRHSERVQTYSQAKGMDQEHEIAVVVQRLVRAEVSGVLFTADPVTGSRAHMTGNYVYGLGEALVSGEAEPHTFTLARPKGRYDGTGDLKRHARKLYRLGRRLEKDLGAPQDVEWALAGGRLYLLQSRPITTLAECDPLTQDWNSSLSGDYLWADSGGVYPEVITPSTWSLWRTLLDRHRLSGVPFIGNIVGRIYTNVSVLAAMLHKLGRSEADVMDVLAQMTGRLPEGVEIPACPIRLWDILSQASIPTLIKQRRLKRELRQFLAAAPARCEDLVQQIQAARDGARLIALWREDVEPLLQDLYLIQDAANESYTYPYGTLRKKLGKLLGQAGANALLATVGGGLEQAASVGIGVGLSRVARGEMSRAAYMAAYGHRHANENELSVPRPYEVPGWLDDQLAAYGNDAMDLVERMEKRAAEFGSAWAAFAQRYPKQAGPIRKQIDKLTAATHDREAIRSELTRMIGVIRAWTLRAGALAGLRDGDAFFLTHQEMLALLAGEETPVATIPGRREVYERYRALPPYPAWIRGRFDPVRWASDPERRQDVYDAVSPLPAVPDSDTISGYPGSAGRVEGTVRRIDRLEEGAQLQAGEILVAVTTNVGWTPLFPRAAAVVTDIGAPLAHAAIVARELGIPAVVGCGNATMRLETGDRVRVDGGRGTVEILASAGAA